MVLLDNDHDQANPSKASDFLHVLIREAMLSSLYVKGDVGPMGYNRNRTRLCTGSKFHA